jgi:hypothetical protein
VDALEVVPQLRRQRHGKRNPGFDPALFSRRRDILDALFTETRALAQRMGLDTVFVEKYSNAGWVRETLDRLPIDGYHVSDVVKPYGLELVSRNAARLGGVEGTRVGEEVQATDPALMDQQLHAGHKEVAILMGRPRSTRLGLRGP